MKSLFSFFLLFSLLILSRAEEQEEDQQDSSFDLNSVLEELAKAQQDAKDNFAHNRSNLNGILSAQNQYTLAKNDLALKDLAKEVQKMKYEQDKQRNNSRHRSHNASEVSQDILDLLNQKPHVLFDDSSSDTSNTDPPSNDEQNEILVAQYCTRAFVESIPPSFCLKTPVELGTMNVLCADGDDEILGICYAKCPGRYVSDGIFCATPCDSGYKSLVFTCWKNLFNWNTRSIKTRDWYTKLNSKAYCRTPKIKETVLEIPLCFNDCEEIDLLNCGPHTCGMTSAVCQQGISNIIKDLLIGLGKLFLNVITFGLSGLLTSILTNPTAMYNAAQAAGKASMQAAYQNVQVWMARINQDKLLGEMVALTKSYVAQNATLNAAVTTDRIVNRCSSVRDIFQEKLSNTVDVNLEWKDFSSKDLRDYIDMCTQANAGDACKRAIRQSVLKWDPTGIVSMVAAFKQTSCPPIN